MQILIVIPVSSSKWNKATGEHALKYVSADTKIDVINLEKAPESIESYHDSVLAAPAVVEAAEEAEGKG